MMWACLRGDICGDFPQEDISNRHGDCGHHDFDCIELSSCVDLKGTRRKVFHKTFQ